MRYRPDRITVPTGDRLVIVLVNADSRRHDLVLGNGARTGMLDPGTSTRLDAGVIGGSVDGWCTRPAHRQSGMRLTITASGPSGPGATSTAGGGDGMGHTGDLDPDLDPGPVAAGAAPTIDAMADPGPGFRAADATAPTTGDSHVHRITLHATEVRRAVAAGVTQTLWTFGGTAPGPVLRGRVGDIFAVTLVNDTSIEHGIDFHAEALAPDRAMRPVEAGESVVYRFTAVRAGIWMYHCSASPMLAHLGNGMYGALIVDPPDLRPVAREFVLVQSEFYLGAEGATGDVDKMRSGTPDAVTFNGYVAQYRHRPLRARAGERVRIWVLDAGPNLRSAFHVVGAPFDTVYVEGGYRLRPDDPGGAQVLDLAPASGGFVELVLPEAGRYPFLTHAMADAERGAMGLFEVAP
jgi:nitrite reductase (NO-forming)